MISCFLPSWVITYNDEEDPSIPGTWVIETMSAIRTENVAPTSFAGDSTRSVPSDMAKIQCPSLTSRMVGKNEEAQIDNGLTAAIPRKTGSSHFKSIKPNST